MDNYYDSNEFDIGKFNSGFEKMQEDKKKQKKIDEENYLKSLETQEESTNKITDLTISDILQNTKNEILDLIYEIISFDYDSFQEFLNLFTKENRLFYIGIFLLILSVLLYVISYIFFYPSNLQRNDININIPNDYSLNYRPYEAVSNEHTEKIKDLENQLKQSKASVQVPTQNQIPNQSAVSNQAGNNQIADL